MKTNNAEFHTCSQMLSVCACHTRKLRIMETAMQSQLSQLVRADQMTQMNWKIRSDLLFGRVCTRLNRISACTGKQDRLSYVHRSHGPELLWLGCRISEIQLIRET